MLGLIISLALFGAALHDENRADSAPCTTFASVFGLTMPDYGPPGELALHTRLWLDRSESTVHVSTLFQKAVLAPNISYSLIVQGPLASYPVPSGVGGDFALQLPTDGSGDLALVLSYNFTTAVGSKPAYTHWVIDALRVPFINWVPFQNNEPDPDKFLCVNIRGKSSSAGCVSWSCTAFGRGNASFDGSRLHVDRCLCCNADKTTLADILTCPIADFVSEPGNESNKLDVPFVIGYLLALCIALFSQVTIGA